MFGRGLGDTYTVFIVPLEREFHWTRSELTGVYSIYLLVNGFTAPLVAARLPVVALVFVAGMVPRPGEAPGDWWQNTGYRAAVEQQAARDGGATGNEDPYVSFYHDVPRELAAQALSKESAHPSAACMAAPWPLAALPQVPTRFVLCSEDRFFPADFLRKVARDRLGIVPDELAAGHCAALGRPKQLADILVGYATQPRPQPSAQR